MEEEQVNKKRGLVIIGGSSGSLEAVLAILPKLDRHFSIPILLVMHRSNASADTGLTELIASRTNLKVKEADEKDELLPGWIYLAPADYHLLFEDDGTLSLDASQKINYSRPSIDVSFISAAEVYKENLIAILLSGANADGAMGMKAIKEAGGRNIVQDPAEALVSYMPEQALTHALPQDILGAAAIARLLNQLSVMSEAGNR